MRAVALLSCFTLMVASCASTDPEIAESTPTPQAAAPETAAPETAMAETAAPEATSPEAPAPETATAETTAPETATPETPQDPAPAVTVSSEATSAPATADPTAVPRTVEVAYFETLPPRSELPSDQACADAVRATPFPETHPDNAQANAIAGGPKVRIDGADEDYNEVLAPRITGDFTGTTEELIRWVACKWGFDEDLTRARAWTESSWRISTEGDETDYEPACEYLGLSTPCFQSYGLLQVKGSVHEGTYPFAHESTAWGLDYAMAWQRACFEGAFSWLVEQGYQAGDVNGCVGAWFSGEWYDDFAVAYLADVASNLNNRPWD